MLLAVFLFVFIGLRVMPVPAFLEDFGFHKRDAQKNEQQWASLPINYASSPACAQCHQSNYTSWQQGDHRTVSCENCHGPANIHLEGKALPVVDTSRELCGTCHAKLTARPASFPQVDMNEMGGDSKCITCHNPHDPRAGMPPQVPHTLENRAQCLSCHGQHEPWLRPPPQVPHTLEGRTQCLSCHGPEVIKATVVPRVPHTLDGRAECLVCHNSGGIKPFPENHAGRTSATCLSCHQQG